MRSGCLKFFLVLFLLAAVCIGIVLYNVASLVELSINRFVSERGGSIEVASITIRPDAGLVVVIQKYSEPAIELEGLQVEVPLLALFHYKDQLTVQASVQRLALEVPPSTDTHRQPTVHELLEEARELILQGCQSIAGNIDQLPLKGLYLTVEDLRITSDPLVYQSSLAVQLNRDSSGKVVSSIRSESDYFGLQASINIDGVAETVAVDFSMSARNWEAIQKQYLGALTDALAHSDAELYIDPLDAASFLDVSGYFRWNALESAKFNVAVLGNIGPSEVLMDTIECTTKSSSFGVATNGAGVFRAYLNIPLEQLYAGSETYDVGECSLRIENNQCIVKATLGANQLELSSAGFTSLFEGFGQVNYSTQFNQLGSGLINSLATDTLPVGLGFSSSVHTKGQLDLQEWGILAVASEVTWAIDDLEWASQSVAADKLSGVAQLVYEKGGSQSVSTTINGSALSIAGIELTGLALAVDSTDLKTVGIQNFNLHTLGGSVHADDFKLKLDDHSSERIRLQLDRIQLEQLAKVVPQFNGELSGSVSGALIIQSKPAGIQINGGGLALDSNQSAHLSYSMNGLLTQGLKPGTAAYKQYQLAERALEDLSLQRFKIDFFPGSDATKPILLTFYGESTQQGTIVPVDYTLNVNTNDSAGLIQLLQMMQRGELEFN